MSTKTIAAISTSLTNSGISIIRISGKDSLDILNKLFKTSNTILPNTIIYGKIVKKDKVLDNVLVSYFKSPKSYTGEDIVEINCHGGNEITRQILELVLENGATLAEAGEFSKRAFINGKMDLSQAEAVINLINAKTKTESNIAARQLEGELSTKIKNIRNTFIDLMAQIEVSVDYPEYDYEEIIPQNILPLFDSKISDIIKIVDTYEQGKYIKDGINVSIIGKPNVGKSSLLNRLAKSDKAIVTNIPGTTRDVIEERINIGDIILNVSDTAGIRDTEDVIEKIGVQKSIKKLEESDLVIYMLSAEENLTKDDLSMLSKIKNKGLKLIAVINKTDMTRKLIFDTILKELEHIDVCNPILISVTQNKGIENLINEIKDIFYKNDLDFEHELIIMNVRHKELLKQTINCLLEAKEEILKGKPIDIISIYIKNAAKALGESIGSDVSQDVIDKIFEKFCLGK